MKSTLSAGRSTAPVVLISCADKNSQTELSWWFSSLYRLLCKDLNFAEHTRRLKGRACDKASYYISLSRVMTGNVRFEMPGSTWPRAGKADGMRDHLVSWSVELYPDDMRHKDQCALPWLVAQTSIMSSIVETKQNSLYLEWDFGISAVTTCTCMLTFILTKSSMNILILIMYLTVWIHYANYLLFVIGKRKDKIAKTRMRWSFKNNPEPCSADQTAVHQFCLINVSKSETVAVILKGGLAEGRK